MHFTLYMKQLLFPMFLCMAFAVIAQEDLRSVMFWNNYGHYNPAFSGLTHRHLGTVSYKNNNSDFGSSNMIMAGYGTAIKALHGGLGVNYMYDHVNYGQGVVTGIQKLNLNYSYHISVGDSGTLAVGLGVGFTTFHNNYREILGSSMPFAEKGSTFDLNAGLMYVNRKWMLGISSTRINEPTYSHLDFKERSTFHLMSAYTFNLGTRFELKPQLLVSASRYETAFNLNLMTTYKKQIWLGASCGTRMASVMAGWDIREKFRIGYSFSYNWDRVPNSTYNGHEVVLGILIK
jgi:type IX secretion system PorP/SprF family membrane protein